MSTTYRRYDPEWQLSKALAAYLQANLTDEIAAGVKVDSLYAQMAQEHKGQSVLAHCHKADTDKAEAGHLVCECDVLVKSDVSRGRIEQYIGVHFDLVNYVRDRLQNPNMYAELSVTGFLVNAVDNAKSFESDGNTGDKLYIVSKTSFTVKLSSMDTTT